MFYYSGSQGAVLPVTGTQSMFLLVRFTTKYLWYKCFWAIITKSALVLPRDELFGVMSQTVWNDFGADSCESKFHSHFSFALLFSISLLFSTLLFYSPVLLTGQLHASAPFFFFFIFLHFQGTNYSPLSLGSCQEFIFRGSNVSECHLWQEPPSRTFFDCCIHLKHSNHVVHKASIQKSILN